MYTLISHLMSLRGRDRRKHFSPLPFSLHSKCQTRAPRLILVTLLPAASFTLDGEPLGVAVVAVHGIVTDRLIAGAHLTGGIIWEQGG